MKQLLLRVDDDLHARLASQAAAQGISMNALANRVLGIAIDTALLSPQDRLKIRLMAMGPLGRDRTALPFDELPAYSSQEAQAIRDAAIASMADSPPVLDAVLADMRGDQ